MARKILRVKRILLLLCIIAINACGGGVDEVEDSHPMQKLSLNAPKITLQLGEGNELIVTWEKQRDAQSYTLHLSTSENFSKEITTEFTVNSNSYLINPELGEQQYYVRIVAHWKEIESQFSNVLIVKVITEEGEKFNLGGIVQGLTGSGLVLLNKNGDHLPSQRK